MHEFSEGSHCRSVEAPRDSSPAPDLLIPLLHRDREESSEKERGLKCGACEGGVKGSFCWETPRGSRTNWPFECRVVFVSVGSGPRLHKPHSQKNPWSFSFSCAFLLSLSLSLSISPPLSLSPSISLSLPLSLSLSLSLCYVHPGTSGTQKSVPFSPLSRWVSLFRAYFWGPFVRLITDYADEVAPGNPERSTVV